MYVKRVLTCSRAKVRGGTKLMYGAMQYSTVTYMHDIILRAYRHVHVRLREMEYVCVYMYYLLVSAISISA